MPLRVLLLTPQFYGVEKKIRSILEASGYEVEWIENRALLLDFHGTGSRFKILRRIYFFLFSPQSGYFRTEFKKIENPRFDILFAINAHVINYQLLKNLKKFNPHLVSVLYLWDSAGQYNWEKEIKWFDNVYTFDSSDSIKYGINYKPNFYLKNNGSGGNETDLFFVGRYSVERQAMIVKFLRLPDFENISHFIKLWPSYKILFHNSFIYKVFKLFNFKKGWLNKYLKNFEAVEGINGHDYITSRSLSYDDIQSRLLKSNVILDLPFGAQSGYTHRVIEALANGKKVLTTNQNIKKETFFNPDQIHFLDPRSPEIESIWVKTKSIFTVDPYFTDLELSVWLNSILNAAIAKDKS